MSYLLFSLSKLNAAETMAESSADRCGWGSKRSRQ